MSGTPQVPRQTTWQFFKKFVRWGVRDLYRHYQALPYSETKGPNYYRPLGYDDRPLHRKLRCKYFWVRTMDHLGCGLITWYYDNRVYFNERFPKYVKPVKGPLKAYLPPLPKRFPDEFIESERERMKRLKMPPSEDYVEFSYDALDRQNADEIDTSSMFGIGKMFGHRMKKRAEAALQEARNRAPGIKDNLSELQGQASNRLSGMVGDERKQAFQAALNQGQDLAKQAAKGDIKGAAMNAKEILDQKLRDNQALKDAAKEKASAFQEVIVGFVQGYTEGKQYEEVHNTDPKELLLKMQENAKKAVFLAANETPGLLKGDGDIQQKLKDFAEKARDLENVKIDADEERRLKEMASAWVVQKGKELKETKDRLADDFSQTEEGKALRAKAEEAARLAQLARARAEDVVDKAKAEAPNMRDRLVETVDSAREKVQQHYQQEGQGPRKT